MRIEVSVKFSVSDVSSQMRTVNLCTSGDVVLRQVGSNGYDFGSGFWR